MNKKSKRGGKRRGAGRKRLPIEQKYVRILITLSPETRARLLELAERKAGGNVSNYIATRINQDTLGG